MILAAEVVKITKESPQALQWGVYVVVPLILGVLTYLQVKTTTTARRAEKASKEAANSVRPNGTGHSSQTEMIEDVLIHVGEVRSDLKSLKKDIDKHINSSGHPETLQLVKEASDMAHETHQLLTEIIIHSDIFRPRDGR